MKRAEIEGLLPEIFRRAIGERSPLRTLLEVMEMFHAPSEQVLGNLDVVFNPLRTDDRFVPFLAGCVDLDRFFDRSARGPGASAGSEPISTGMGRLRELVARAAYLSAWRGTAHGLIAFLETATGVHGFSVEESVAGDAGTSRPFHIRIRVPAEAAEHDALIERIIQSEKPAYVTYETEIVAKGA